MTKKIAFRLLILLAVGIAAFALAFPVAAQTESSAVTVFVDGLKPNADAEPILIENRTMLPLRAVFESLGASVEWNGETRTVSAERGEITLRMTVGDDFLMKNDERIPLEVPSVIRENRTFIPLRAVAESFDCAVYWDGDRRVVRVVSAEPTDAVLTEADSRCVARLGDYDVSESEWNLYESILTEDEKRPTEDDIVAALTDVYAVKAYADANSIVLPPEYTDGGLYDIALFQKSGKYDAVLTAYNTTDTAFRNFLRDTALGGFVKGLFSDVSEKDSADYARTHFVRVKHVLTPSAAMAQKAADALQNGESFEDVIKTYGTDLYDQTVGYIFGEGMRTPNFEKAALALGEGEISDIIETPFGFHIIKRYSFDGVTDEDILKICSKEAASALASERYRNAVNPFAEKLVFTRTE